MLDAKVRAFAPVLAAIGVLLTSTPPAKPARTPHGAPLLPREELLRTVGAGQMPLVADYFWVQVLQATYRANTPEEFHDVFDYADLLTDLDPLFRQSYIFAAATLPVQDRAGNWYNTLESTRILEKGYRAAPDHVFLRILLAYNLAIYHHQYRRAADLLTETAKMPHAPRYLPALATRLYAQAGEFDAGLYLAQTLMREASDEDTQAAFRRRVKEIQLERILKTVDRASERFSERTRKRPSSVEELVRAGDLPGVPADPFGGSIVFGADGRSYSTAVRERLDLHVKRLEEASP